MLIKKEISLYSAHDYFDFSSDAEKCYLWYILGNFPNVLGSMY